MEHRLDVDGVATVPDLLTPGQCAELVAMFDDDARFRSTVVMQRVGFGAGTYRYFADPLPELVQHLRTTLYPRLAVANDWAERLGEDPFPTDLGGLLAVCAAAGQHRPTPLLLRYGADDYNCLHQDVYGDVTFPLQLLVMLNRPDEDFTGGESVFVEQRPRQQSRPVVLRPRLGEAVAFPVRHRPPARGQGMEPRAAAPRGERRAQRHPARARRHLPRRPVKDGHRRGVPRLLPPVDVPDTGRLDSPLRGSGLT